MTQVTVLRKAIDDVSNVGVVQVVTMKNKRINEWLIGGTSGEEFFHRNTVACVQMVVNEAKCAMTYLAEHRERHHFLVVAFVHKLDVWVFSNVWRDRFFSKLVEGLPVDVSRSLVSLSLSRLMVYVKLRYEAVEGFLEDIWLHELLESYSRSRGVHTTSWLANFTLLLHEGRVFTERSAPV